MLKQGDKAPDFELKDGDGKTHKMSDYKGTLVVYFYPRDDTPGCTIEAIEFKDKYPEFQKKEVDILGVSPDNMESHQKFTNKYSLPFPLLADIENKLSKAYSVYEKKRFMGREFLGIIRSTFIINNGKIVKVFPKVTPKGHAKMILEALE
ncbi:thioredoxin-dependent thiol peroxidase [Nanoarchaeota archaeon]